MVKNFGYAARDTSGLCSPFTYEIREPGEDEILLRVKYCGICHSDIHAVRSEWGPAHYPLVPGHEIIGEVIKVGALKTYVGEDAPRYPEWKVGDIVGVGCLVASCETCRECRHDFENNCETRTFTYDSIDYTGAVTQGGYGKYVVLNRRFAIRIPPNVDYRDAAPLLCAGITTFSPLYQHNIARGNLRIGVLGMGGLGHMAVQYAAKLNPTNEVFVFSRNKKKEALAKRLGAKQLIAIGSASYSQGVLVNSNAELDAVLGTLDYIVDTVVSGKKPMMLYANLLCPRGTWIMLGAPPLDQPLELPALLLISRNQGIAGSAIGGIAETQKMIDYSFENNIMPMVEHVRADQINEAQERVVRGDIEFRFIIDIEESYAERAMIRNFGYAARNASGKFSPLAYETREPGEDEILLRVKYCGICHSDIQAVKAEWVPAHYPLVPGHEIIGEVIKVGPVTPRGPDAPKCPVWRIGDVVGVGCMVGSCERCHECRTGWENHCDKPVFTYNSIDRAGMVTQGGYGKYVVLNRRFAVRIPPRADYRDAAPLLCAGITAFSPLNQHNIARGNLRIGVIGLGSLGHMAVQYAAKLNRTNEVFVFSRSKKKEAIAKNLGARGLIAIGSASYAGAELVGSNPELDAALGTFDYIVDTVVTENKPMMLYANLLRPRGNWIMLGAPPLSKPMDLPALLLISRNQGIIGSSIGGIAETQKMIDYSFENNIMPMVEHVKADKINEAQKRFLEGDVKFCFVIDVEESYAGQA